MLETVCKRTDDFIFQMPKTLRKAYGQFFTSKETARFMASLFSVPKKKSISILDAGAGSGILSIAVVEKISKEQPNAEIQLTCYENDPNILPLLKENLESLKIINKNFFFEIITENYITSQTKAFNGLTDHYQKYDLVVGNPPYKKISKSAKEAQAMPEICYGAPNLYFLFAAMGIFNLDENGEMVYITPRSWTSGAYFERFRRYLISKTSLEHIHLFNSRTDVFDKESVLQETIIFKLKKTNKHPNEIVISSSSGNGDFERQTFFNAAYKTVISPQTHYVFLPSCEAELDTLNKVGAFDCTLPSLNMKMKTGLVVDFRVPELLESEKNENNVPLFFSKHIKDGRVLFPAGIENEYVSKIKKSLLQSNRNYLFIKRFTSKEEQRRLQCGIYLKRKNPDYTYISTQNKINFIDGEEELSECTVYGLYVLFNSTLYDSYYRILNGSTQVNSTEVNTIPIPKLEIIQIMGQKLLKSKDLSEKNCNSIITEICA